jgi:hypothetical protein
MPHDIGISGMVASFDPAIIAATPQDGSRKY